MEMEHDVIRCSLTVVEDCYSVCWRCSCSLRPAIDVACSNLVGKSFPVPIPRSTVVNVDLNNPYSTISNHSDPTILPIHEDELNGEAPVSIGGKLNDEQLSSVKDSFDAETDHWNVSFGPWGTGLMGLVSCFDFRRRVDFDIVANRL